MKQEYLWDEFYSRNQMAWRGNTIIPIVNTGEALDLGCGNGKTVSTLIDNGFDVTGVDFSKVAIEQCRNSFKNSRFEVASVTDLPFEDDSFDYVTAVHVLEHLDDPALERTVNEIRRVLKDGGYVFIRSFTDRDMRSHNRKDSQISYRFYDVDSILEAFKGFEVVSAVIKEEKTRFNALRSRVEALLRIAKA